MKVKELITKLETMDAEDVVCFMDDIGNTFSIDNIERFKNIVELSSKEV